jgi:hypothetical protein
MRGVIFVLDIREILLSGKEKTQKREDLFSIVGEDDGKGCIILRKHYLYNPKRKSKPIKIPVKDFWGTAGSFIGGVYKAQYLPEDKKANPKETQKKLKRLQKYLKAESPKKKSTASKKSSCKTTNKKTKKKA